MADILFVQNYYEQMLGIMHISAVLKQNGFTTDVAIGPADAVLRRVERTRPRVVGFYCTTGFHHRNVAVAAAIKRRWGDAVLTLFGGPHPTFVPEMIRDEGVDMLCRGEGEYAVLDLLRALRAGEDPGGIPNLTVKKDGQVRENPLRPLCEPDELPHPDRELYREFPYIHRARRQEVMIGRGCPFDCTFCSTHAFKELYRDKGTYCRFRSIPKVIDELRDIRARYRPTCFFFHDDTFLLRRAFSAEFLEAYKKEIGLPFACLIRADLASDELIAMLKGAGCYLVSFGIESGNERIRNQVLKKKLSDADILRCGELLHKHRIPFATFNMVGLPDETLAETWDTVNLNVRVKPNWAWFSVYQPLPKTELARYAVEKGYLASADVADSDASFHESSLLLRAHPEHRQILRLKNGANLIVRAPFLKPLFQHVLLRLPLDRLYGLLDKFLYFTGYYTRLTYRMGLFRALHSALFLLRHLREF